MAKKKKEVGLLGIGIYVGWTGVSYAKRSIILCFKIMYLTFFFQLPLKKIQTGEITTFYLTQNIQQI